MFKSCFTNILIRLIEKSKFIFFFLYFLKLANEQPYIQFEGADFGIYYLSKTILEYLLLIDILQFWDCYSIANFNNESKIFKI